MCVISISVVGFIVTKWQHVFGAEPPQPVLNLPDLTGRVSVKDTFGRLYAVSVLRSVLNRILQTVERQ